MSRPTIAILVAATAVAGCGGTSDPTGVERWFDVARERLGADVPTTDVMQIDPTAPCGLVDDIETDGRELELFGSGVARFGEIGGRYQCAWSGDATGTANMRLEVVTIDDPDEFDEYVALVPTRAGNEVVDTEIGEIQVASFEPDPDRPPVTTAVLIAPSERGGVHLVVELLDPALEFSASDYAELLVQFATG